MKILVHDYSGHPFQVQLSRELARRGHDVVHAYFSEFQTPRGALARREADPASFRVEAITLGETFAKTTFLKRRQQEIAYGRKLGKLIEGLAPDLVISSNAPLDAQWQIQRSARKTGAAFVFWLQDLYGQAIHRFAVKKWGAPGHLPGRFYRELESMMLRASDAIVAISEDFVPVIAASGISADKVTVIENWAPLDEIPLRDRGNAWAEANGLNSLPNVIYSGTLGYKHNPDVLLKLARSVVANILVFSEGAVAEQLAEAARREGLDRLQVRKWVPFEVLPDVLGAANILVALIEPDAGIYSVPSKILTYMSVGRPVVAAVPKNNLAARILEREGAGLVAAPGDDDAFCALVQKLLDDPNFGGLMGRNGRLYAERTFDIARLGTQFEELFAKVLPRSVRSGRSQQAHERRVGS